MLLSAPAILFTAAVTALALVITIAFAIMVSRIRRSVGIQPPAMTGNPRLERAIRVHGNTVESLLLFLPALWLAALYFQGWVPPIIGLLWCLGRLVYAIGYMSAAEKRTPGFIVAMLSVLALVILAVIGIVMAWTANG